MILVYSHTYSKPFIWSKLHCIKHNAVELRWLCFTFMRLHYAFLSTLNSDNITEKVNRREQQIEPNMYSRVHRYIFMLRSRYRYIKECRQNVS